MKPKEDYYKTLGLTKSATDTEIKSAYRKQAMRYHPDKNPGDKAAEDKFRKVTEAYETLGDPEKRKTYDFYGRTPRFGSTHSNTGSYTTGSRQYFYDVKDYEDLIRKHFSAAMNEGYFNAFIDPHRNRKPKYQTKYRPPKNIEMTVEMDLEETMTDTTKEVSFTKEVRCSHCIGKESTRISCPACHGRVRYRRSSCSRCGGIGTITQCSTCGGTRKVVHQTTLKVSIPRGAMEGTLVKLSRCGNENQTGIKGDVILKVALRKHDTFTRDYLNLALERKVSFADAALGSVMYIDVLGHEKVKVKLKPGTQSGTKLRIPSKGLYVLRGEQRGHLIITIQVVTPTDLSPEQRRLFGQLHALEVKNAEKEEAKKKADVLSHA